MNPETNILKQLGLNDNEILVYEELLKSGKQKASQISKKTPLKRGLIYKTLEDLEEKGLIIREDAKNIVSTFTPIHPNVLKGLAENQLKTAQNAQESLQNEIGSLISMYNLANNKPGVEFYEGIEGIKKVINDVLTATETVCTIIDLEQLEQDTPIKKINTEHLKQRKLKKIYKKILVPNTAYSRNNLKNYNPEITELRILPKKIHIESTMQIYDNKITYATSKKNARIGMIITDESTYLMHKNIFEILWEISTPIH